MPLFKISNPGMAAFHIAIAALMVGTGTINTLAAKLVGSSLSLSLSFLYSLLGGLIS